MATLLSTVVCSYHVSASDAESDGSASPKAGSFYALLGAGWEHDQYKGNIKNTKLGYEKKFNLAAITVGAGYQFQFQNKVVTGVEITCDVDLGSDSKEVTLTEAGNSYNGKVKKENCLPQLALLFGYSINNKYLPFIKIGGAYSKQTHEGHVPGLSLSYSNKTVVPFLSAGCDYKVNEKFGIRIEANYNFHHKKTVSFAQNIITFKRTRYGVKLAAIYHI